MSAQGGGRAVVWGLVPAAAREGAIDASVGGYHTMVLRADGRAMTWGYAGGWVTNRPVVTGVVAVSAGWMYNLVLLTNGTIQAWGDANSSSAIQIPAHASNDVAAIACGPGVAMARKMDGTLVMWGDNSWGQMDAPAGVRSGEPAAPFRWKPRMPPPPRSSASQRNCPDPERGRRTTKHAKDTKAGEEDVCSQALADQVISRFSRVS